MYKVPLEDESGNPLHTLWYRGFHVILNEPLTAEEEAIFKQYLDYIRNIRKEKGSKCPAKNKLSSLAEMEFPEEYQHQPIKPPRKP